MQIDFVCGATSIERRALVKRLADEYLKGVAANEREFHEFKYDLAATDFSAQEIAPFEAVRQGSLFGGKDRPTVVIWEGAEVCDTLKEWERVRLARAIKLGAPHVILIAHYCDSSPGQTLRTVASLNKSLHIVDHSPRLPSGKERDGAIKQQKTAAVAATIAAYGLADRISKDGAAFLNAAYGDDTDSLEAAVNCLAINADEGRITVPEMRRLVGDLPPGPFEFIEALLQRQPARALPIVESMISKGQAKNLVSFLPSWGAQLHRAAIAICCPGDHLWLKEKLGGSAFLIDRYAKEGVTPTQFWRVWDAVLELDGRLKQGTAANGEVELYRLAAVASSQL